MHQMDVGPMITASTLLLQGEEVPFKLELLGTNTWSLKRNKGKFKLGNAFMKCKARVSPFYVVQMSSVPLVEGNNLVYFTFSPLLVNFIFFQMQLSEKRFVMHIMHV